MERYATCGHSGCVRGGSLVISFEVKDVDYTKSGTTIGVVVENGW